MAPRVGSCLDYDKVLAIPMPKPPQRRYHGNSESEIPPKSLPFSRSQKRSIPEAAPPKMPVESAPPTEGKKRSRLDAIKSKLSFKDLHKEAVNYDKRAPPLPHPSSSEKQDVANITASGPSTTPAVTATTRLQHSTASSRLPTLLPVTGTRKNVGSSDKTTVVDPTARLKSKIPTSPSNLEVSGPEKSPVISKISPADYPSTEELPPKLRDPTGGSGRVKYLPRSWVESSPPSTPSPTPGLIHPAYLPRSEESSAPNTLSQVTPGIETSLASPKLQETGELSPYAAEVAKVVKAVQRQTDMKISKLSMNVSELSTWKQNQLDHRAAEVEDIKRTNAELISRVAVISEGVRKSRLSAELDLAKTTQRVKHLEERLAMADREDIEPLKKTVMQLIEKTDAMSDRYRDSPANLSKFMDTCEKKLTKMENDIAQLQKEQMRLSSPPTKFSSFSSERSGLSSDSRQVSISRLSPLPRSMTGDLPSHNNAKSHPPTKKTGSIFPRSLSFKGRKEGSPLIASAPGSFSQPRSRASSAEEPKRLNPLVSGRRDTDSIGSSHSAGKFSWRARFLRDEQRDHSERTYKSSVPLPPESNTSFDTEHSLWALGVSSTSESQSQYTEVRNESLTEPSSPIYAPGMASLPNLPDLPGLPDLPETPYPYAERTRSNSASFIPSRDPPPVPNRTYGGSFSSSWHPTDSNLPENIQQIPSAGQSTEDLHQRRVPKAHDNRKQD